MVFRGYDVNGNNLISFESEDSSRLAMTERAVGFGALVGTGAGACYLVVEFPSDMIKILRRIFGRASNHGPASGFSARFEMQPELIRAVVMSEVSSLAGVRCEYEWEEYQNTCRLTVREFNLGQKTNRLISSREVLKSDFDSLFKEIEQNASIGNYAGPARDGVTFMLCWGSRSRISYWPSQTLRPAPQ